MDKINLLIFDVDGTLVDSLCGATASVNVILARNGLPQVAARDVATYINHGGEHFISHAAATEDPAVIARLLSEFTQEYHDNCWAPPYEGVLETLEVLQKRGKTLGVYSNKMISVAQKQMELIRADALLDFICADDGNTVLKPKPDAILQMLRRTGCPPGEAMMVGDSEADLMAGHSAGIKTCFAAYGIGKLENSPVKPDYVIESFAQLLTLMD